MLSLMSSSFAISGACAAEVQDRFGNFRDFLVSFFVCHVFVPFMKVLWFGRRPF